MDSASIANNPYLFEYTFTLASNFTGSIVRYKLQATNSIGSTTSSTYLSALLAGIPGTPTSGPVDITTITSATLIGV